MCVTHDSRFLKLGVIYCTESRNRISEKLEYGPGTAIRGMRVMTLERKFIPEGR